MYAFILLIQMSRLHVRNYRKYVCMKKKGVSNRNKLDDPYYRIIQIHP